MNVERIDATKEQVALIKMKKLIKSLQEMRGNGTSMISLAVPPKGNIHDVRKMFAEEHGKATNIRSRV